MAKVPLKVREARDDERALVFKTWLDAYADSAFARVIKPQIYRERQRRLIEAVLRRPTTHLLVATSPIEDDVVLGWAAVEAPDVAHFVFVKSGFRRFGIATELFKSLPAEYRFSHRVPNAESFIRSFGRAMYDPYASFRGLF